MAEAKCVVITGVSRGLGQAMVQEFVQRGHTVLGCARSQEAIAELNGRYGDPHRFEVVDIRHVEQVEQWSRRVLDRIGPPDLLINNAALMNRSSVLWEVPSEEFAELLNVNLRGMHNVIRAFVPQMVQREQGIILNFSSTWGRSTSPQVAPYCATKWAVEGLTQALAHEIPRGMAAIPFNPGVIQTEMLFQCFGDAAKSYPTPDIWAKTAVPFILQLGPKNNGASVSAP